MALASVANTTAAPREPPPNEILELLAHGRSPTRPAGTSADNAEAEAAGHSGPPALGRHGAGGHSATKAAKAVRLTASELLDALGRHAIAACPGLSTAEAVAKMWGEQRPTTRRFHATSLHSHASVLFALTPWSRFSGNAHSSLAAHCRQARCWEAQILHRRLDEFDRDPASSRCRCTFIHGVILEDPGLIHAHASRPLLTSLVANFLPCMCPVLTKTSTRRFGSYQRH